LFVVAEDKEKPELEQTTEEAPEAAAAEVPESVDSGQAEEVEVAAEDETPQGAAEPPEDILEMADLRESGRRGDIYYYGTGRRKTSSAQVRLYPSKEPQIVVNDKPAEEYFSRHRDILLLKRPLQATATEDMFRITVKVEGGGITGQAGAIRHGIARALTRANPELRRSLRREGSLTRDPRMKERKKPGLKRARKAPQYTKR
jgi:small subunit ribosomal protein S9